MKKRNQMVMLTAVVGLLTLISACATHRVNLLSNGTMALLSIPSKMAYINDVDVYKDGSKLIVAGYVRRIPARMLRGKVYPEDGGYKVSKQIKPEPDRGGHLDIVIQGSDGNLKESGSFLYYPRRINMRKSRPSHFAINLEADAQPGSTVRVAHHNQKAGTKNKSKFDCGNNAAMP